jgi:hypothetical protein
MKSEVPWNFEIVEPYYFVVSNQSWNAGNKVNKEPKLEVLDRYLLDRIMVATSSFDPRKKVNKYVHSQERI